MKKKNNSSVSLLVYIKSKFRYGPKEERLTAIAKTLQGKYIGGGTNLANGKRDQQFLFNTKKDAHKFMNHSEVSNVITSQFDLQEIAS